MSPDPAAAAALSPEDAKLVTLARATRARVGSAQGAALRDSDGRTYAAATVDLPHLRLSAVQACVAMAVSAGARGAEAAVLLGDDDGVADDDLAALADLGGTDVVLHRGDSRGRVITRSVPVRRPPSAG